MVIARRAALEALKRREVAMMMFGCLDGCCNDLRVGIRWAVSGYTTGVLRGRVHDLG